MIESKYLLERRAKMTGHAVTKPVEAEKPKQIAKRSEKMKVTLKELKKSYTKFLKTRPFCEIKAPGCTKIAVAVHHVRGRGKNEILNVDNFLPCCQWCNGYLESHDEWARKKGFKKSRLSK